MTSPHIIKLLILFGQRNEDGKKDSVEACQNLQMILDKARTNFSVVGQLICCEECNGERIGTEIRKNGAVTALGYQWL